MRTADPPGRRDTSAPTRSRRLSLSVPTVLGALGVAFLLGFVPMWWTAHTRGRDLNDLAARHVELQLESTLARAALLARQGEHEAAREAASQFFTELNREVISGGDGRGNTDALRASLSDRDEIITLLARGDPAAADRLAALYMQYRTAHPLRTQ